MPFRVRRVTAFLVDETYVKVGKAEAWVWVAIDPIHRFILGVYLSRHRNMLVAEAFLRSLVEKYGRHVVYSDGASWYPEACRALGLKHRAHSAYEKSLIERAIQYLKDRMEGFDDFYPCFKKGCSLEHVYNWLNLFSYMYNIRHMRFKDLLRLIGGDILS